METDCDCLVTQTDLITYYASESGVLVATVTISTDAKQVDKTIKVTLQAAGNKPVIDTIRFVALRKPAIQDGSQAK